MRFSSSSETESRLRREDADLETRILERGFFQRDPAILFGMMDGFEGKGQM